MGLISRVSSRTYRKNSKNGNPGSSKSCRPKSLIQDNPNFGPQTTIQTAQSTRNDSIYSRFEIRCGKFQSSSRHQCNHHRRWYRYQSTANSWTGVFEAWRGFEADSEGPGWCSKLERLKTRSLK